MKRGISQNGSGGFTVLSSESCRDKRRLVIKFQKTYLSVLSATEHPGVR